MIHIEKERENSNLFSENKPENPPTRCTAPDPAASLAPRYFKNPISDHIQCAGKAKVKILNDENNIPALKLDLSAIAPDDIEVDIEHNPNW